MAWVKMRHKSGSELTIPEPVYLNMFKDNEAYSLVEEPKPYRPKTEVKKEIKEELEDGNLSGYEEIKRDPVRKSTKKAVS